MICERCGHEVGTVPWTAAEPEPRQPRLHVGTECIANLRTDLEAERARSEDARRRLARCDLAFSAEVDEAEQRAVQAEAACAAMRAELVRCVADLECVPDSLTRPTTTDAEVAHYRAAFKRSREFLALNAGATLPADVASDENERTCHQWNRDCGWTCPTHRRIHFKRPTPFDPARPIQTAIPTCPETGCGALMMFACVLERRELLAAVRRLVEAATALSTWDGWRDADIEWRALLDALADPALVRLGP